MGHHVLVSHAVIGFVTLCDLLPVYDCHTHGNHQSVTYAADEIIWPLLRIKKIIAPAFIMTDLCRVWLIFSEMVQLQSLV